MSSEDKLTHVYLVMNGETFSQTESARIVGSRRKLFKLIGEGKIRAESLPRNKAVNGSAMQLMY